MGLKITREEAERCIGAVQKAVEQGNRNILGAAATALNISPSTLKSRVGCKNGDGGLIGRYFPDLKVNWEAAPQKTPPDYKGYFDAIAEKQRRYTGEEVEEPKTPESTLQKQIVRLQDENKELRKKLQDAHRQSNADDAIRQILGGITSKPVDPPAWLIENRQGGAKDPEVPVTIWSDWHAGEVVSSSETNGVNAFDMQVLEERLRRLVDRTIDLCKNHGPGRYPGIVINLLGDFVSGGLHPELLANDEQEVIPTVLRVRDLLVWALGEMMDAFGHVYCPCTAGNHGRATHKPEFKRYVYKNFDWLLYQLLARHFESDKRIVFDIPDSNEVRYRVYGQRYLAMHGDMLGTAGGDGIIGVLGPLIRGETKIGKQSAAIGLDYDVLLVGHWHQQIWLQRIICANSLKGFDEYARLKLRAYPSTPSQPLWFVHSRWGRTLHRDIFLEDPDYASAQEWVSFRTAKSA